MPDVGAMGNRWLTISIPSRCWFTIGPTGARMAQDEGGASRDEIAAALVDVSEGRVPKDRIALRELYREIMDWPFVEAAPEEEEEPGASASSPYEAITPTGVEGKH